MSEPKDGSAVADCVRKLGAVGTVFVAALAARHFWQNWRLDRKLARKRASCDRTLRQVEQQLQQVLNIVLFVVLCI